MNLNWNAGLIKDPRRFTLILAGALAAMGVGLYLLLYQPLLDPLQTQGRECHALENEVARARNDIAMLKTEAEKTTFITEEEVSLAMDELTREGKWKGINFISITPRTAERSEDRRYRVLPIEMEIGSTYEGLGLFLGSLDELQKSLVTVGNFRVNAAKEDASRLRTNLTLHLCLAE